MQIQLLKVNIFRFHLNQISIDLLFGSFWLFKMNIEMLDENWIIDIGYILSKYINYQAINKYKNKISVPEEAPFTACVKYVCEQFKVNHATSAVITNNGVGINPEQSAGIVLINIINKFKKVMYSQNMEVNQNQFQEIELANNDKYNFLFFINMYLVRIKLYKIKKNEKKNFQMYIYIFFKIYQKQDKQCIQNIIFI
ncbi:hypothetical protein IMG5_062410 [Ichthyophthirius multifiliis]|uniref:Ubiquitin-fold modifier 1 n=1 Tax=Ichthyophthirius multifiliis TaxID=5932 RepID=G0QNX6_ICHMU|nr:hypothetical protein IMG5_062410 [Ichthyophthirius multifiliis]EGR33063.1 hypothetical protein IMG5_062410 [Ichthyophthirius multifiliis]|eukprot:XP_004037049.1 hypothetical protein IMG5_062410 [Ichthyophthirius multifiliis]